MASQPDRIAEEQSATPRGATPVGPANGFRLHARQIQSLRRGGDQPVYRQLQELIRGYVASGAWKPGEMIPAEKAFAQRFGVARMTVRQAIEGLMREGLLERVRGRGTFVTHPRVERELARMHSFTEDMHGRGMTTFTRLLARRVVPAPEEVSAALRLGRREAVLNLQRLRFADDLPMALETCYLNYESCQAVLEADLEAGSLYEFLEQHLQLRLSHATQELQATLPDKGEAELLQASRRQPMLVITQTTYVDGPTGEQPTIYGRTVYRADRYRFRLEVPRR